MLTPFLAVKCICQNDRCRQQEAGCPTTSGHLYHHLPEPPSVAALVQVLALVLAQVLAPVSALVSLTASLMYLTGIGGWYASKLALSFMLSSFLSLFHAVDNDGSGQFMYNISHTRFYGFTGLSTRLSVWWVAFKNWLLLGLPENFFHQNIILLRVSCQVGFPSNFLPQLQQVLCSSPTPAHPPALEPTAESEVYVFLDSNATHYQDFFNAYHAHIPYLSRDEAISIFP